MKLRKSLSSVLNSSSWSLNEKLGVWGVAKVKVVSFSSFFLQLEMSLDFGLMFGLNFEYEFYLILSNFCYVLNPLLSSLTSTLDGYLKAFNSELIEFSS
jgi:hypothetical protein